MRFKERNDLANRCKEWMKDQQNNITTPLDTVHMVLAYLDVNGYLNNVVRCKDCKHYTERQYMGKSLFVCNVFEWHSQPNDYCSFGERKEEWTEQ